MAEAHEYGWVRFPDTIGGTQRYVKFTEKGEIIVRREAPVANINAVLDANEQARNHTSGKMLNGDMVRACAIPEGLRIKWLVDEGWDCQNPEHNDMLVKKLNDISYRKIRTGGGRVALQQDGSIR